MSRIRILPDALASQVAAGEVVERPAAVVRELVENSLDAGATQIEVHVQRGGAALIRVTDNGGGMDREDALLSLERHATSKIRTKEDLAAIRTLGFRGEALPSIASVSRFRLATREAGALAGTEIEVNGGRMQHVRDYGGAPGTVVEARSLFFNVPARRKFLRSEPTEAAHVEQQFRLHAIANIHASFTLVRDNETVFQLPATPNELERIEGLAGRELARRLLPMEEFQHGNVMVHGYIGGPGLSRSDRKMQVVFLNGRAVDNAAVHYALREGYHTMLMKGQHPITFLFLEMPPGSFDVNVHPAKKEVRFHEPHVVREAIVRAVNRTLTKSSAISTGHPTEATQRMPMFAATSATTPLESPSLELVAPAAQLSKPVAPALPIFAPQAPTSFPASFPTVAVSSSTAATSLPPVDAPREKTAEANGAPPPRFRILGVLHRLYVLMESAEGLVLMDQHAAHERVLFEQLRHAMEREGVPSQRLLLPVTLEVPPHDFDVLQRHLETLHRLGVEAEPFGANALKIDALPAFLKTDDPQSLLRDILEEIAGASSRTSALRLGEDMIATTVCRHAVKANDSLRTPELEKLVEQLFACEMPYCCPHGRPTLIQISHAELEKKFGRRAP